MNLQQSTSARSQQKARNRYVELADTHVPFDVACQVLGFDPYSGKTACPLPDCGERGSAKLYDDHLWTFCCQKWLGGVGLVAAIREIAYPEAAKLLLKEAGLTASEAEAIGRQAELKRRAEYRLQDNRLQLAEQLKKWCSQNCANWKEIQFEPWVSEPLAALLGVLPAVTTPADAQQWMDGSCHLMGQILGIEMNDQETK